MVLSVQIKAKDDTWSISGPFVSFFYLGQYENLSHIRAI
jgi:hypothetical protein